MPVVFARHSLVAQTAYQDLVSLLLAESDPDIRGTPTLRQRSRRGYWYDRYRVGDEVKERYLGEDTGSLRQRLEGYRALKPGVEARRRERSRLVRLLRSEHFLGADRESGKLLASLAKAGVFRHAVLVGSSAFRIYEGELGLRLPEDQSAIAANIGVGSVEKISLAFEEADACRIDSQLRDLSFDADPHSDGGATWRWRQTRGNCLIQFLAASAQPDGGAIELPTLGVSARKLPELDYLIAAPIKAVAVYRDGVLVQVPRPERFAMHQLFVAANHRGREGLTKKKRLAQARLLITILAHDRPTDLAEAYHEALARRAQWRDGIASSLAQLPEVAEALRGAAHS